MDNQLYRELILEHWKNPQNFGVISDADINISDYNPLCGDKVVISANLKNDSLENIKFEGEGCAISIAASSILTEIVKDKKLVDVKKMTQQQFLENLEVELSPARLKCALLGYSALQKAIVKL